MKKAIRIVVCCDRCGKEISLGDWLDTHGFHIHKKHIITTNYEEPLELCRDCYDSLQTWWENGKEQK